MLHVEINKKCRPQMFIGLQLDNLQQMELIFTVYKRLKMSGSIFHQFSKYGSPGTSKPVYDLFLEPGYDRIKN